MTGRRRPSPAMIVALVALFVALSGSAIAAGIVPRARFADRAGLANNSLKLGGKTAGQLAAPASGGGRCQPGSVQAVAVVTGTATAGIQNLPDQFTSDKSYFGFSWSCAGAVAARRVPSTTGVYEVQFRGLQSGVAVGATAGGPGGAVSVVPISPGTFRVYVFGSTTAEHFVARSDLQFSLVAF